MPPRSTPVWGDTIIVRAAHSSTVDPIRTGCRGTTRLHDPDRSRCAPSTIKFRANGREPRGLLPVSRRGAGRRAGSLLLDSGDDAELRAKALVSGKSAERPSNEVRPRRARAAPARSACGQARSDGNRPVPVSRLVFVASLCAGKRVTIGRLSRAKVCAEQMGDIGVLPTVFRVARAACRAGADGRKEHRGLRARREGFKALRQADFRLNEP